MEKKIYFYSNPKYISPNESYFTNWEETENALDESLEIIRTLSMGILLCSDWLFKEGYRIFIHDECGMFEVTYGNCARTNREIRPGHNIFKMWMAGEFTNYEKEN